MIVLQHMYGDEFSTKSLNLSKAAYSEKGSRFGFDIQLYNTNTNTYVRINHQQTGRKTSSYVNGQIVDSNHKFGTAINGQGVVLFDDFNGGNVDLQINVIGSTYPLYYMIMASFTNTEVFQSFSSPVYFLRQYAPNVIYNPALDLELNGYGSLDNEVILGTLRIDAAFTQGNDITSIAYLEVVKGSAINSANTFTTNTFHKNTTLNSFSYGSRVVTELTTLDVDAAGLTFNEVEPYFLTKLNLSSTPTIVHITSPTKDNTLIKLEAIEPFYLDLHDTLGNLDLGGYKYYVARNSTATLQYKTDKWYLIDRGESKKVHGLESYSAKTLMPVNNKIKLESNFNVIDLASDSYIDQIKKFSLGGEGLGTVAYLYVNTEASFTFVNTNSISLGEYAYIRTASNSNIKIKGWSFWMIIDKGTYYQVELISSKDIPFTEIDSSAFGATFGYYNWSTGVNLTPLAYRKRGNVVSLSGAAKSLTATALTDKQIRFICNIPADLRPSEKQYAMGYAYEGSGLTDAQPVLITIETSGEINLTVIGSLLVQSPITSWVFLNMTYFI